MKGLPFDNLTPTTTWPSRNPTTVTIKLRYITGRGGSATQGLSLYLSTLVNDYQALANDAELHRLSVDEQIKTVMEFCRPATHLEPKTNSRLSCQIVVSDEIDGLEVNIPSKQA